MLRKSLIFVLLFSFIYGQNYQNAQNENVPLLNIQNQKYNTSLEKLYQTRSILRNTSAQVLESELDAEYYIVGPGDQFRISIFGELENQFDCEVQPEGVVLIPTVGKFHISGFSLQEAKKLLNDAVSSNYINADIAINLTGLRKFRVYYTGEVKAPGTYFAQGSDRLSDIVEVSEVQDTRIISEKEQLEVSVSLNDWSDNTQIEIRHKDGKNDTYDLSRFYSLGDKSQNPYLKGGDVIFVPSIDLSDSIVTIEGNVEFQGIYRLKQQENLLDFLRRVSALSKKSNLRNILLDREGNTQIIDLVNDFDKYKSFILKHNDRLLIQRIHENVYVRGEVFQPGPFPYNANYTARDYIGLAGATDDADDVEEAIIYRQATGEILNGGDVIIEKGDTIVVPKRPREIVKDYITILAPVIYLGVNIYYIVTR